MTQHEFLEMLRENHTKMLLNKKEVAAELGISQAGIDRLRQTGQLRTFFTRMSSSKRPSIT